MKASTRFRRGFTMIEMLTVIAIIAILAAIIFPALFTMRKNMTKQTCLTNLHSIAQAIKMYKDDYRVYPEALYGYVPAQGNGSPVLQTNPDTGQIELVARTFLFPQYIKDRSGFRCPLAPERTTAITPDKAVPGVNGVTLTPFADGRRFLSWDSYDGNREPPTDTNSPYRVHYLRAWDPTLLGQGKGESPRQLIYRYPPDTTVITWCTYHRSYTSGDIVEQGSVDMALFLDGRAKAVPSSVMLVDPRASIRQQSDVRAHLVESGT